jgi:hypothetical protein
MLKKQTLKTNHVDEQPIKNMIRILSNYYELKTGIQQHITLLVKEQLEDDFDRITILNTIIASTLYCCKMHYIIFDINNEAQELSCIFHDPQDFNKNLSDILYRFSRTCDFYKMEEE